MMDVQQVIDDLQERDLLGVTRSRTAENATYSCPFVENHGGKTWQQTPSFGIRLTDAPGKPAGAYNCFSCHAGSKDIADLWSLLTGQTVEEAEEEFSQAEVLIDTVLRAVQSLDEVRNTSPVSLTDWPVTTPVESSALAMDYLRGRGIPQALWQEVGLEWCGEETMPVRRDAKKDRSGVKGNRIVFPLWWEGRRVGYSSRAVGYETDLKYYRPVSNMNTMLYDPRNILLGKPERVFVVEGEMDCLAALREGLPAVSSIGSGLTRQQAKILGRSKSVVFLYDPDQAGIRGVARVKELYSGLMRWRALWLPKGQDPASMPPGWGPAVIAAAQQPAPDLNVSEILNAMKGI